METGNAITVYFFDQFSLNLLLESFDLDIFHKLVGRTEGEVDKLVVIKWTTISNQEKNPDFLL